MFIDQFGLGNIMMPVQRYQPFDPGQGNQQRMLTGPGQTAAGSQQMANPFASGMAAIASGTPPSTPPSMPPGWSTPPFNPNGTPPPTNPPPTTVSGPVTPGGMPEPAVEPAVEPVTVDEQGNVVTADKSDFGPGVIKLKEGPTRADRMKAGFMMLAASGTNQFSRVAGTVNAGLNQKQADADAYNQQLLQMTRPRYEEGTDKDGRILRKSYPALYEYDPATSTIREIPGAAAQAPKIEVIYDPLKDDKGPIRNDQNGVPRYEKTGERVFPGVEPDPESGTTLEKLAVPQRIVELGNIIEDPETEETVRQDAREELAAIQQMLPGDEVAEARKLLVVNSVKNSEARLAAFAEGMDGVVYAKRVTEDMLERISTGKIDTGILSGILTNMGLGDVGQGELKAKQIFQLLQNLQITKLTPVSNFEIDLVSQAWADVANGKSQNIGALQAALEVMNAKMDQGFSAYGRDLQNVKSANESGAYDNILNNYESYLTDYGWEVSYDEQGRATVRRNIPVDGLTFDDLWNRNQTP
jgi:hypothetical protein